MWIARPFASLAQLVEHVICNLGVVGSSPTRGSLRLANSYFEVLEEKATRKKLTEVNGDAVEEEVTISSSVVDGNKALEVLVERFC